MNAAVTTLENSVIAIANANSSTAESDIHTAIAAFDSAILDTTGLFGLNGPVNQVNSELGYVPHNLTAKQTATTIDNVSGTATVGGPATLTATLNSATGTGLVGKVVSFTLDGAFAGTAVTDSSGVATLTGVPQSDTAGTDTGGIVASFAGDSTNKLSQNSGDLVVSQSSTTTTLDLKCQPQRIRCVGDVHGDRRRRLAGLGHADGYASHSWPTARRSPAPPAPSILGRSDLQPRAL